MDHMSIATDFDGDAGCPEGALRAIAEAGFTHVHWCHHWCTDFLYGAAEMAQIAGWLKDFGLGVLDLHGSAGGEKGWVSAREYERLAGVSLVANRIEMTARLGGGAVVMHVPREPLDAAENGAYWDRLRRSLDELEPFARVHAVRIAVENTSANYATIGRLLRHYGPDYLGTCYDVGHGNVDGDGPARLADLKDRLVAVHMHDNDGSGDQHNLPFSGTVDWPGLARVLAESSYEGPPNLEVTLENSGHAGARPFLDAALSAGRRIAELVDAHRGRAGGPGRG